MERDEEDVNIVHTILFIFVKKKSHSKILNICYLWLLGIISGMLELDHTGKNVLCTSLPNSPFSDVTMIASNRPW